ncbi:UDP-N-acetylmuramate--L-alanine ligase [Paenibacillus sp. TRM 82003]|uniref:UDP-N-acetylmuramate--L-alanine ligase n=1 Tax=Kineococcus sp. TRM81007 TaxID=2925831 RepID=UPI001F55CC3E|nr:UDP-N-acetylmuramate--L-alanine ligase [Kineococcus sp. TRM81007]MCI2239706.1 UDP-N-acetylmuramate--L-alanine ligase [Kineococcus sp. TRM81007]MCI3926731.1 UDP-N-acetylmuramate--L-alanine ligase [Paenibacillus sp. TRM 82003]
MSAPGPVPVAELGRVHLLGIGGVGVSGVARLLLARGVVVSGSDAADSEVLRRLAALGARVAVGHDAAHLGDLGPGDTLVVSTAVRPGNPELVAARERGMRVLHRSEALAALMVGRRGVAVAGTHGKTTTSSMLAVALLEAGLDPGYAIGGELTGGSDGGARDGSGPFVAEADESDGSFRAYAPVVDVVTNVEPDHLDHYGTAEAVALAFEDFVQRLQPGGVLVACADDAGSVRLAEFARQAGVRVRTYGTHPDADVRLSGVDVSGPRPSALVHVDVDADEADDGHALPLRLAVPGLHNLRNAVGAFAAALELGAEPVPVLRALEGFGGARRRFEHRGAAGGVRVVDDYAHHPTEVEALLRAARPVAGDGRVVVAFQPHLVSRTRAFADEFGRALALADEVVVLDVYVAREDPDPAVTGELVARAVPLPPESVTFAGDRAGAARTVVERLRPGDLLLTVGAGDVTRLGPEVLDLLAARSAAGPGTGEP